MLLNSGMTKVNIDQLSEEELVELNHKIVARLRFLRQMQSHTQMLDYRIGERVRFYPAGQPEVIGTLTRYNKKSVTVITESAVSVPVPLRAACTPPMPRPMR